MATAKASPSLRAYRNLQKKKAAFCAGKVNKTAVKQQAANYKKAAMKAGKSATDADKTIRKVLTSGCKMSSSVNGRKRTTKRRTTAKRRTK
ncbi:MAG: hypothetical protein K9I85_06060 [Saprospiraceae bacterium]|nr:hypothetical protein [Saprospiraceae bacterium]